MRITNVTSQRDVTLLSLAVTVVVLLVVILVTMILYPQREWAWEFLVNLPIATLLSYGATGVIGRQMLRNHALTRELQRLVDRDRLTNVATRDFFFDRLAEAPGRHGVTLMLDIDHFKQVNDTHGHLIGDKVIAHAARQMTAEVGARDIVCRFGGEEFVIFLENATRTIAHEMAERIRQRIAAAPVECDGARVTVTVSVGGSTRHAAAQFDEAIREADAALYRAKECGRNRTVMTGDAAQAVSVAPNPAA